MKKINKYKLNPSEKLYASAIEEFLNYGSPKHKARILIETCDKDSLRMHVKSIYEQRYGLLDINQPNRNIFHMILSEDYASRKLAFDLCMHYAIYSDILLFCIYYLFNYNVCTLKEKIWYYLHNIEDRSIYMANQYIKNSGFMFGVVTDEIVTKIRKINAKALQKGF